MKPYVWEEGMTEKEMRDGAYFERNMLALLLAHNQNYWAKTTDHFSENTECGWYIHGEWEGWTRVISLFGGQVTFHVPDDFDLGDLPQIKSNWDGHSTEEKWKFAMDVCGCKAT
jgi:hypothetical protein